MTKSFGFLVNNHGRFKFYKFTPRDKRITISREEYFELFGRGAAEHLRRFRNG